MKRIQTIAFMVFMSVLSWGATRPVNPKADVWAEGLMDEVILTPRVIACGDWTLPPIITLGTDETLEFSFDLLARPTVFTYRIEHCNSDWEKSDLLYSEYMDGFDNEPMDIGTVSQNTTFEYAHYSLVFPNESNTPKVSGNYRLTVMEGRHPLVTYRFCIVEPGASVKARVTDVTDIDTRDSHQQVTASVETDNLSCFDAMDELRLTVFQNMRFDNAARVVPPDFIKNGAVSWMHCKPLVFEAGNGFRRFEITDVYANTMNVDRISYQEPYYHATLNTDSFRESFQYDSDHNGRFMVHSTQTGVTDPDTEADYVFVHFELESDPLEGGVPYIFFLYDGAGFSSRQKMQYRGVKPHCYEAVIPMKMGAYDYQYLWVPNGKSTGETGKIEGNWHTTPNEYLLLLYQRRPGDQYDRLVGYSTVKGLSEEYPGI